MHAKIANTSSLTIQLCKLKRPYRNCSHIYRSQFLVNDDLMVEIGKQLLPYLSTLLDFTMG
jgi:hypothetical protein